MDFAQAMVEIISDEKTKEADNQKVEVNNCNEYTETERKIVSLLTENTGVNILDSGGKDNRRWQQNRKIKNFNDLPVIESDFYFHKKEFSHLEVSLNVFHFLKEHLLITEISKDFQREFEEVTDAQNMADISDYLNHLTDYTDAEVTKVVNTYNWENDLGGVLQFAMFDLDKWYIILQIHTGNDVRGGYTNPYIFQVVASKVFDDEAGYEFERDMAEKSVRCKKCGATWDLYEPDPKYAEPLEDEDPFLESIWYAPTRNVLGIKKSGMAYHKNCGGVLKVYPAY
jgi:hypothetical protein